LKTFVGKSPAPEQSAVKQTQLGGGLILQYPQKMKTKKMSRKTRRRQINGKIWGEKIVDYGNTDQLNTGTLAK